jgi:hypothetical protein
MPSFNDFMDTLKPQITQFAETSLKNLSQAAVSDGQAFLADTQEDLERWTKLLATGDLTEKDFTWLVASKKDSAEMLALKQKGLAKVAVDQFTSGLVDIIVSTAIKTFL